MAFPAKIKWLFSHFFSPFFGLLIVEGDMRPSVALFSSLSPWEGNS
jgi:hypothetical protein